MALLRNSPLQESVVTLPVMPYPSNGMFNIKVIPTTYDKATIELMDVIVLILITEIMQFITDSNFMMMDARAFPHVFTCYVLQLAMKLYPSEYLFSNTN